MQLTKKRVKRCGCQIKGAEGRREEMDGGQNGAVSHELVIVFEDAATESPMGESPHSTSETFTFCPQAFCVCTLECVFVCMSTALLSSESEGTDGVCRRCGAPVITWEQCKHVVKVHTSTH